ncbi:MAG: phosphonate C-P lyase system protein PhnH [Desulfobulbaceae bacterium]|nr:MAG: phosphonate C-P lyase system protein PhnH [Desulfobulbaceae bacterium]
MNNSSDYKDDIFDNVHSCQKIFKALVMALAYPGTTQHLDTLDLVPIATDCCFALQPLIALLDLETSHHVFSADTKLKQDIEQYLEINSSSSICQPEDADFILCLDATARPFYHQLRRGTLSSPQLGTTMVYQVDSFNNPVQGIDSATFTLAGPGIKTPLTITATGIDREEPALWHDSRQDYPLGIDLYLVSKTGEIMGIPRSVKILQSGVN